VACASGQAYADMAEGEHTFQVRATDRAGNGELAPVAFTWRIGTVAPVTTIDHGHLP
jgi:large repetitive protein